MDKKICVKMKKPSFLDWNSNILASSLKKIDLNIFLIVFLDGLFYLLSGYAVVFWLQRVQEKMAGFSVPADIMSLGAEAASQLAGEVKKFYYLIIFSLILLLMAIIFLASILKGIIWARTTGTRITSSLISRFFILNLMWMGFWFIALFLVAYLAERTAAPAVLFFLSALALYLTNTLYAIFMKEQKFKSILSAIKLNFSKLHLFALPYALAGLLFYVVVKLSTLLKFMYSAVLLGLVSLIYVAAARYYISALVFEIEGKK